MRTTLVIPDAVYERAKKQARAHGRSVSALVTEALDLRLNEIEVPRGAPPFVIPSWDMGVPFVDVNDRDALYRAMEE